MRTILQALCCRENRTRTTCIYNSSCEKICPESVSPPHSRARNSCEELVRDQEGARTGGGRTRGRKFDTLSWAMARFTLPNAVLAPLAGFTYSAKPLRLFSLLMLTLFLKSPNPPAPLRRMCRDHSQYHSWHRGTRLAMRLSPHGCPIWGPGRRSR